MAAETSVNGQIREDEMPDIESLTRTDGSETTGFGGWLKGLFKGRGERPVTLADKIKQRKADEAFAKDFSETVRPEDENENPAVTPSVAETAVIDDAPVETQAEPAAPISEPVQSVEDALQPEQNVSEAAQSELGSDYARTVAAELHRPDTPEPDLTEAPTPIPSVEDDSADEPDFLKDLKVDANAQNSENVHPLNGPEPVRPVETARTPAFFPEDVAQMNSEMSAAEIKRHEKTLGATARESRINERRSAAEAKRTAGKTQLENTVKRVVDKAGDLVGVAYSVPDRAIAMAHKETGRVVDSVKQIDIDIADWRNRAAEELEVSLNLYSATIENVALVTEAGIVKKLAEGARTVTNVLNTAASVRLEMARNQLSAQSNEYAELAVAWGEGKVTVDILDEQIKKMDATRKKISEIQKSQRTGAAESLATGLVVESAKVRTEAKKRKENGGKWLAGLRRWLVGAVDAKPNLA